MTTFIYIYKNKEEKVKQDWTKNIQAWLDSDRLIIRQVKHQVFILMSSDGKKTTRKIIRRILIVMKMTIIFH